MLPATQILDHFCVPYKLTIVSACRTPDRPVEYARSAAARGLRPIVAGAGGTAHLPCMVAAMTVLPVIDVPVKGSSLDGVDSVHSIVQMLVCILQYLALVGLLMSSHILAAWDSVAMVAINNETNASLLVVRILGACIPQLGRKMETHMKEMEREVPGKVEKLELVGLESYHVVKRT